MLVGLTVLLYCSLCLISYWFFSVSLIYTPLPPALGACKPVCRRTARNLSRDRMGVVMRLSQNLIYGLFVAFFVMHLDNDISKGAVQDRIGIIYQSIAASPYTGMLNAVALCEFNQRYTLVHEGEKYILLQLSDFSNNLTQK